MTNGSTSQEDAAQAVLQAAVNMGYSGADIAVMESTYQGCGYNVSAPCSATCGNGFIECGEVCDGGALGGMTCGDFGCTGGGSLLGEQLLRFTGCLEAVPGGAPGVRHVP
jgi:hypothetical protein